MHTLAVFLTSDPLVSWRYTQSRRVHAAPYWHSGMRVLDACFFFVLALKCKVFPVLHCERPMLCGIVCRQWQSQTQAAVAIILQFTIGVQASAPCCRFGTYYL